MAWSVAIVDIAVTIVTSSATIVVTKVVLLDPRATILVLALTVMNALIKRKILCVTIISKNVEFITKRFSVVDEIIKMVAVVSGIASKVLEILGDLMLFLYDRRHVSMIRIEHMTNMVQYNRKLICIIRLGILLV